MKEGKKVIIPNLKEGLEITKSRILNTYNDDPMLIFVAGASCSGKSYFADKLYSLLNENNFPTSKICLDNYYKNHDNPTMPRYENHVSFDQPGSCFVNEARTHINIFLSGKDFYSPEFLIPECVRVKVLGELIKAGKGLITDGLHSISMSSYFEVPKVLIFVNTVADIRLQRMIIRNNKKYNQSKEFTIDRFCSNVEPQYYKYVLPQKDKADIVIENNFVEKE